MKKSLNIGVGFAVIWIILKLVAFNFQLFLIDLKPFIFANMLFVTLAICVALYLKKRTKTSSNLLDDIKTGMATSMIYTVIISGFIFFYYQSIYPEFNTSKISEMEILLKDESKIKELRKSKPDMENRSSDEIRSQVLGSVSQYYSAKFTMIISLLGLLIYSTLNSLLISIIFRKVIFKHQSDSSAPSAS
tara:strand:+ start:134 stop:703 length:570 start_codon:yes stop_codon:yes gene_type:complete